MLYILWIKYDYKLFLKRVFFECIEVFKTAAQEKGIPENIDFNRGDNFGVGYFDVNQRKGLRLNASTAFIKNTDNRKNLHIVTDAVVRELDIDTKSMRCRGVTYIKDKNIVKVSCRVFIKNFFFFSF